MESYASDTKTALLLTAGELFAEYGFEAVSTRMIADKANVNLGGIRYHFGSKEDLYVAALKQVCQHDKVPTFADIVQQNPELANTLEGKAQVILLTCRHFFQEMLRPQKPEWRQKLIVRELSNPSAALPILINDVFKKECEKDTDWFKLLQPEASDDEAIIWLSILKAHGFFYLMSRKAFEIIRGGMPLDENFCEAITHMVAKAMILLAGLPLPAELTPARKTAPER